MTKDDSSPQPDDPRHDPERDENAPSQPPADERETVPGDGEKTIPNILESTIESAALADAVEEMTAEDAADSEPRDGGGGVGEKTVPDLLESTIESITPTDSSSAPSPSDSNDSSPQPGEKTEPNILESTVESVDDAGQRTRKKKVRLGSQFVDLEKTTPNIEQTIAPFGIGAGEKTLDANDLEQTVSDQSTVADLGAAGAAGDSPASKVDASGKTLGPGVEQTVDLGEFVSQTDPDAEETHVDSPLASADLGRTINPREMSQQDAALWDSLAGKSAKGQDTRAIPAIERSFTETKLQIRPRAVVTPQQSPETPSDYRLIRLLGKGGMGNVFIARQESLDRIIAVKVIKPLEGEKRLKLAQAGRLEAVEADRRHQFLSEAVVTGDLDHPNIVPIYDIAVTPDESLFYAMKRVIGTPWSKVLSEKSLAENLDILLRAADAVGFAHTRGVVHRDIKPENIMLGDFGVVMVMDWGLALPTQQFEKLDSIAHTAGLGGTPAFMAPEMATGPIEKIDARSDVYLLGATLFQIVTGKPPHQAENVSACIRAVATNSICEVQPEHRGELLNIALKAMATNPEDRFSDVPSFQTAIREYRAHAESITLASRAAEDLQRGQQNRDYNLFSRATYGFEEAIALWGGNQIAEQGLAQTIIAHAEGAYENGDYDLGLSLLDHSKTTHQPTILKLQDGLRERELKQSRLVLFKRVAAAMLAFILLGGSVALYLINEQSNKAEAARAKAVANAERAITEKNRADAKSIEAKKNADEAARNAEEAKKNAEIAENNAKEAEKNAEQARKSEEEARRQELAALDAKHLADKNAAEAARQQQIAIVEAAEAQRQKQEALRQKQLVEYEVYLSQIGLAKARIDRNEFDDARRILQSLKDSRGAKNLGWEWRWLWHQANQSLAADQTNAAATDLAIDQAGRRAMVVLADGTIELLDLTSSGGVERQHNVRLPQNVEATAVAFSRDDQFVAVGTISGEIEIFDRTLDQRISRLRGHDRRITDLDFAPSGQLISASTDRSARLWNTATGEELATCWHLAAVSELAVAQRGSEITMVTAVADSSSGRAVVWNLSGSPDQMTATRMGEFLQHDDPVSCVAITPRGDLVATGDSGGNLLIWRPDDVGKTDYAEAIAAAVRKLEDQTPTLTSRKANATKAQALIDESDTRAQLIPLQSIDAVTSVARLRAHDDRIESIRFSDDGEQLVSTSDDYTLKLWNVTTQTLTKTLRGHGGWVTDAKFMADKPGRILSISRDGTIRTWDASTYVGDLAMLTRTAAVSAPARESQAHADEIWSARFDPSGQRIVSASRDHTSRILQIDPTTLAFHEVARLQNAVNQGTELNEGTAFLAMSVAIDRAHRRLYIGSADAVVRVWDLDLATELARATGTGLNTMLALSKSGRMLLTGSSSPDAKTILWDVDPSGSVSPRVRYRLQGHDQAVTAFAISPAGDRIFTADRFGLGILWDANTGRQIGDRIELFRGFRINSVSFSSDGKRLLIASDDQQLTILDVDRRERVGQLKHDGFVTQVSLSDDGRYALTVSESRRQDRFQSQATLWNLATETGRVLDRVERDVRGSDDAVRTTGARINSAVFGQQSRWAIISRTSNGVQGQVKLFAIDGAAENPLKPKTFQLPTELGAAGIAVPISNQSMLTLNGDAAFLWDLESMGHIKSYRAHGGVTRASFSFDGRFVATSSRSVKIWDANTGLSVSKLENPHRGPVRAMQFSPVGPQYILATASDDGVARIWTWDPKSKEFTQIRELQVAGVRRDADQPGSANIPIRSVDFSPDGRALLTVGAQGTTRIWQLADSTMSAYDVNDPVTLTCGVFSPDGKWIVAGGDDKLARMWKVGAAVDAPIVFQGHADRIEDIQVLMDGSTQPRILTASRDKSARVWDPRIGSPDKLAREVVALRRHTQGVTAIDVTTDGQLLMTAGRDGAVILWPAAKGESLAEPENAGGNR
jgi:WD40 repeat protein/serine/threonine protein kinase